MAKPPAAVSRTYRATGQWQLHLLSKRARFHCVNCQQDRTARHVATRGADWAQTICRGCYGSLTRTQSGNAKTAGKAKPGSPQAKQAARKAKLNKGVDEQARVAATREEQLQRQLPGAGRLLEFFRAAGIRVEVSKRGSLRISNRQTRPLAWILPAPTAVDWDHFIDLIACEYAADVFLKAVADNARFGDGLRAFLRPSERGFAIMRGGVRLAVIRPTSAHVRYREAIYGNFLTPGAHWQRVADVLHNAEAELLAEWKRDQEAKAAAEQAAAAEAQRRRTAMRRRIDHLPDDLAPSLVAACLDASRRIRLERQVAYERPVVLEGSAGELTLLPIVATDARLLMPFRLSNGTQTVKGELLLGDSDPLPLLVGADVASEDAITAWTCALLGFADATCIDPEPEQPAKGRQLEQPRQRPRASASQLVSTTRILPRHRQWPRHLEPIGPWVHYSGSFVGGHRRRLLDGQAASAEACDRARQVGIILHANETWVRPHTRGLPDDVEMRFLWHAPTELKSCRTHGTR